MLEGQLKPPTIIQRQLSAMVEKKKKVLWKVFPVALTQSGHWKLILLFQFVLPLYLPTLSSSSSRPSTSPPLLFAPRYRPEAFYLLPGVCNLGWVIPHLSPQPLSFIRFSRPHPQVRLSCYKKHHVIWHLGAIPVAPSSPAVDFFFFLGGCGWGGQEEGVCTR